jgi:hypothetical protein
MPASKFSAAMRAISPRVVNDAEAMCGTQPLVIHQVVRLRRQIHMQRDEVTLGQDLVQRS